MPRLSICFLLIHPSFIIIIILLLFSYVGSSLASNLFISLLLLVSLVVVIGGGFAVGGRVEGKLRAKHAACTAEEERMKSK